jgi:hypothetical protein
MMAVTPETADAYVMANIKHLELCLPHMESSQFFHSYRTIGLTLGNLNWQKWVPRDFLKITYHRPQNSVCFGEIIQLR